MSRSQHLRRNAGLGFQGNPSSGGLSPWRIFARRFRRLSAGGALAFMTLLATVPVCGAAVEYFVSPAGADAHPGTREQPFASLEAARDAIRQLKSRGSLPAGGITVWVRGGDYVRTRSFELGEADSGTAAAPIVYRVPTNEIARLLGGRVVSAWSAVTDSSVLARLGEKARLHVRQADLRAAGITNYGELKSRGFGRAATPAHLELFFNDQPMTLARYPNEGEWERIAGIPAGAGENDGHGSQIGKLAQGFQYAGERPSRWKTVADVWVHGYWSWDWANSYERIQSLDASTRWIKTAPPHGLYGFRKGQRFYYLNVLEELDQPGEWYLERERGVLYFWPPGTGEAVAERNQPEAAVFQSLRRATVSLLAQPLFVLKGASHITMRGFTFEASRGHGVSVSGGSSNRIAACLVRNVGNYGVWIDGGRGHRVSGCDLENTGDGGVHLSGGERQTLTPAGHSVENTHFQRQGRWSKCYVPAVLANGVGHRIAHNLIHDHPHCAVLFNGNEHQIEFNEIHHIALETGDVGAIYTGRDWTYRGNRIRHNFIHHTGGVGMGSMGVYMDDCVSGTEIYGNVFYRVTRAAFLGGGRDHRVENNIFVDCQPAVSIDGRGLDHSPVWHNMVYDYMKQQLGAVPKELYRQRYAAITHVDHLYATTTNGIPPEHNVVARNISVGGKWLEIYWHAKESMIELRENYVGPDPGFAAPDRMDFRLRPDSPALKTGFQPIPFDQIGLENTDERRELNHRRSAPPS